MEGRSDLQEIALNDAEWWATQDEGYWQALLEQGEIAPEATPPAASQDTFQTPGAGSKASSDQARHEVRGGNGPDTANDWQSAQLAFEEGQSFNLKVSGANRGGLLVNWNGLQGFVPASHLEDIPLAQEPHDRVAELSNRIGDSMTVRMIEVDAGQNRLVFSERAAAPGNRSPKAILNSLNPGDVCEGTVTNLTTFGAFVDLGGVEGLIHISELSWDRVQHPSDVLRPGQKTEVHVLGVNAEEGRIALSTKQLRPDPWAGIDGRYRVGEIIEGTITNVVSFGAFVRVEEGLEGLIHSSELAEGNFLHPRSVVHEGDEVKVRILKIDPANHRLGLSLRQAFGGG